MKQMVACISALIAAHLTFSTPAEVLFADDPPTSERCAVYAKIVLPMQSPGEGTHPPVESLDCQEAKQTWKNGVPSGNALGASR